MQFCRSVWDAACEILSLPLPLRAVLFGKYVRTERYVTRRVVGPLAQSPRSGLLALAWGHANGDYGIYRDRCVRAYVCGLIHMYMRVFVGGHLRKHYQPYL